MNTITHALLPAIAAGLYERSYLDEGDRRGVFSTKRLIVIGIFGAAPDILNPHIYLEERYTSWSHGIPFWAILTMGLMGFWLVRRRDYPFFMVAWLSGAYLLHIFCDAISGGVAWLYPFGKSIAGAYYIPPIWWIPLDISCFLFAYGLFRAIPHIRRSRRRPLSSPSRGDH